MITGNKIKLARQLKNIQQKEMAERLNMEYSTYSRIERGDTRLTEDRVEEILKILDIDRDFVEHIDAYARYPKNGDIQHSHKADAPHEASIYRTLQLVTEQIQNQNKLIESFIEIINRNRERIT